MQNISNQIFLMHLCIYVRFILDIKLNTIQIMIVAENFKLMLKLKLSHRIKPDLCQGSHISSSWL